PHHTTSPLLITNLVRPVRTCSTISRATQSPPASSNMSRCTPGSSFTSSTVARVTQPWSTFNVMTSVRDMNGIMTRMSSLVTGSKIIFTSRFTTSSATRSGITNPNISTNSLSKSGLTSLYCRYIMGRESPQTANENPELACCAAALCVLPSKSEGNAGSVAAPERSALRSNLPFRSDDVPSQEVEFFSSEPIGNVTC